MYTRTLHFWTYRMVEILQNDNKLGGKYGIDWHETWKLTLFLVGKLSLLY